MAELADATHFEKDASLSSKKHSLTPGWVYLTSDRLTFCGHPWYAMHFGLLGALLFMRGRPKKVIFETPLPAVREIRPHKFGLNRGAAVTLTDGQEFKFLFGRKEELRNEFIATLISVLKLQHNIHATQNGEGYTLGPA